MRPGYLLLVTALAEGGTGLSLLLSPPVPLALLLGEEAPAPATLIVSRVAGAALLSLGVMCWAARNESRSRARSGLLLGVLVYDVLAAVLLASAGLVSDRAGVALWPAVVLHFALALWCSKCLLVPPTGVE